MNYLKTFDSMALIIYRMPLKNHKNKSFVQLWSDSSVLRQIIAITRITTSRCPFLARVSSFSKDKIIFLT